MHRNLEDADLNLLNRDFRSIILNIFKELKKKTWIILKQTIRIGPHQIDNIKR